jgi:hypothetical protein
MYAEVWAQDRYVEIVQRYGRPQFYLETALAPMASPDSMRLIAHMKISYDNAFLQSGKTGSSVQNLALRSKCSAVKFQWRAKCNGV